MIHHFTSIDSTNTMALQLAEQGACHGTVVHADRQTKGRGRNSREFFSPAGGLYFSLIIKPELKINDLPLITLAAGVGLFTGIRQATGVAVQLKWPNDLYLDDRKLGGILIESGPICSETGPEFVVVGVGMNVNTDFSNFPSSLRRKVVSLYHAGNDHCDIDALLSSVVQAILISAQRLSLNRNALLAQWRELDYLQGRKLEYIGQDRVTPATGVGLAYDGQYIIRDHNGVELSILAGDLNPIKLVF